MPKQWVFLHGPGAGGCAEAFHHQLRHFPGALAPTLPGQLEGSPCSDVKGYAEWVRGWLWAQGKNENLLLAGFTLGACIAIQYALDYPEEVQGIALTSIAMRPKKRRPEIYSSRIRASEDTTAYEEWASHQRHMMKFVEPVLREQLMERHLQVGPLAQMYALQAIDAFDISDRIASLKPRLLLIRGMDDPSNPPEYEKEIHEAVPGSSYVKLSGAGHFSPTEQPGQFNRLLEEWADQRLNIPQE